MQDGDGIADVQGFAQPAWTQRVRVENKSCALVPFPERVDGIIGSDRRRGNIRQNESMRCPEAQLAVRLTFDRVTFLVDRAMMATTEHGEVRKGGGPTLGPVPDVMTLAERHAAPGKPAAAIAVV